MPDRRGDGDVSLFTRLAVVAFGKVVGFWLWYCGVFQRIFPSVRPDRCASPGCASEWHDTFAGYRFCKVHHPEYETSLLERIWSGASSSAES